MKINKIAIIVLSVMVINCLFANLSYSDTRETYYREASYLQGTYYQTNTENIPENELSRHRIYAKTLYNSKGKLLEEVFYLSGVLVCRRIYSPRFNKALREELVEYDYYKNKIVYNTKNFYGERNSVREKSITSAIIETPDLRRKPLFVKYIIYTLVNRIEVRKLKQYYVEGKIQHTWVYYYDTDGTLMGVEERNKDNKITKIGRSDLSRNMMGIDDRDDHIVWRKPGE